MDFKSLSVCLRQYTTKVHNFIVSCAGRVTFHVVIEADIKALKTTYSKIMKKSRGLTHEGKAHMLIVYCGGHGATQQEK